MGLCNEQISFYDLTMTILFNGTDNSKQEGRKTKTKVHGNGRHNT